jgi:hypothetical protein
MGYTVSRQRLYASLLALGACILLFRTTTMLVQGNLKVLMLWVSILLFAEMLLDVSCLLGSGRWWFYNDRSKAGIPLRLGAAAAILHAIRVLVFVMGRVGPWIDFDVRPEQRAMHDARWTWTGVYIAAILSVLGIIGVIVIWTLIRRARKKQAP